MGQQSTRVGRWLREAAASGPCPLVGCRAAEAGRRRPGGGGHCYCAVSLPPLPPSNGLGAVHPIGVGDGEATLTDVSDPTDAAPEAATRRAESLIPRHAEGARKRVRAAGGAAHGGAAAAVRPAGGRGLAVPRKATARRIAVPAHSARQAPLEGDGRSRPAVREPPEPCGTFLAAFPRRRARSPAARKAS